MSPRPQSVTGSCTLIVPLLLAGTGCATSSDLSRLDQDLTARMVVMERSLQTRLTQHDQAVRESSQAADQRLQRAVTSLQTLAGDTRRILADATAKEDQLREAIAALVGDTKAEIHGLQERIRSMLLQAVSVEAAALKGRLRALDGMRQQLEQIPVESSPPVTTAAPEPTESTPGR